MIRRSFLVGPALALMLSLVPAGFGRGSAAAPTPVAKAPAATAPAAPIPAAPAPAAPTPAAPTPEAPAAFTQNGGPALSDALARLQRDPAYAGRIVGTHVLRAPSGSGAFLYEVRILSPGDRIIIVYLDPDSGAVVGNPRAWVRNR